MVLPQSAPTRCNDPFRPPPKELRHFATFFLKNQTGPTEAEARRLINGLTEGDPLVDRWLAYVDKELSAREARELVNQALLHGVTSLSDPPAPLLALFQQVEAVPEWLEPELLGLASQTFRRNGRLADWILSQVCLMGGYRHEGVVQPLLMTGRLDKGASRRLAETSRFVLDVNTPGALQRGEPGYRAAIEVRLLHGRVRARLRRHPQWQMEDWGLPINQADMLGTNLLFSLSFLLASRAIGMRYTKRERHSVIHLWRYVGTLMGIKADLLPTNETEAHKWFYLVGMIQTYTGQEEASKLGQALHQVPKQRANTTSEHALAALAMSWRAGLSRFFLGDEAADHLGLPHTPLKYIPWAIAPVLYGVESLRRRLPGATAAAVWLGGKWQQRQVERALGPQVPLYHSPSPP